MADFVGFPDGPPERSCDFDPGSGTESRTPPGWAHTSETAPTENSRNRRKVFLTAIGLVAVIAVAGIAFNMGRSGVRSEPTPSMSPTETVTVAALPSTVAAPTTDNRSASAPIAAAPIPATAGGDIRKFLDTMHGQNTGSLGVPPVVVVPGGDEELLMLANVACAAYEKGGGLAAVAAVKAAQPNITFSQKDPRLIPDAPTFLELKALNYICPS
jgi:hypothetical protein